MVGRLFVDKMAAHDLGGHTTNLLKMKHNFSVVNQTMEQIVSQVPDNGSIPTGVYHVGRYVAIFQFNKDLTMPHMAFINYEVDLQKHFDHFADFLSPKTVAGFYKMQQIIAKKPEAELNLFVLSDDPLIFQKFLEN